MAGLWCVNIGYGRAELAEVAAEQMRQLSYFSHTAMNLPAAALAEKINALMGGGYHTYFVNSGSEANEAGFKDGRIVDRAAAGGFLQLSEEPPRARIVASRSRRRRAVRPVILQGCQASSNSGLAARGRTSWALAAAFGSR